MFLFKSSTALVISEVDVKIHLKQDHVGCAGRKLRGNYFEAYQTKEKYLKGRKVAKKLAIENIFKLRLAND